MTVSNGFLPITAEEMKQKGWDSVDFVIVTGDAYVDHPSFGTAIISRVLENAGYRVGIIPQPDPRSQHTALLEGFAKSASNTASVPNECESETKAVTPEPRYSFLNLSMAVLRKI